MLILLPLALRLAIPNDSLIRTSLFLRQNPICKVQCAPSFVSNRAQIQLSASATRLTAFLISTHCIKAFSSISWTVKDLIGLSKGTFHIGTLFCSPASFQHIRRACFLLTLSFSQLFPSTLRHIPVHVDWTMMIRVPFILAQSSNLATNSNQTSRD